MSRPSEPVRSPRERVIVCGVVFPDFPEESGGPLSEVRALVQAAEAEPVGEGVVQRRDRPDSATLFGMGKVEEIRALVEEHQPDAVVVDDDLTPAQVRNLEKAWKKRVIDRSELILDIFARRAQTRQARLQVELAQNEYLLPRLRRMWTHLERTEGAIGTRGPGETQLETDRRLLAKRITDLKRELSQIERRRQRQVRSRGDEFKVGLVGYTNAGKSTLLNRLTGAHEFAADMPFATLDTRTRRWILPDRRAVLLSDTVGFLQRLPHHLVASFHATLEETLHADLLLHVVDASHPDAARQMVAVDEVLASISPHVAADVLVFNKVDRVSDPIQAQLLAEGRPEGDVAHVSAVTGAGLDLLTEIVRRHLDQRCARIEVRIPPAEGRFAAHLRAVGGIQSEECAEDGVLSLRAVVSPWVLGRLMSEAAGGVDITVLEPPRVGPALELEALDPLAPDPADRH